VVPVTARRRRLSSTVRNYKDKGEKLMENWPFDQPQNCAVITLRQIVENGQPILYVSHDLDDHGWQFLTLDEAKEEDARMVLFKNIIKLDTSIYELAHMPPGFHAYRKSITDKWVIEDSQ